MCLARDKEETGAKELSIVSSFAETYHTYYRNEKWIIKHTHWYIVNCKNDKELVPETEEDIEEVIWMDSSGIKVSKLDTYPAIKKLLKLYKNKLNA